MDAPKSVNVFNTGILAGMDATAIAEGIRNKDFTAKEASECVRERAEKTEPIINAIVAADYELNLSNYQNEGFFAGVPMFLKDLVKAKGFPTRFGSEGIPPVVSKKDEKYVQQFNSAGFLITGKSATSEFGMLPSSETKVNGDTCNPHNPAYSTGGSSGGAGALAGAGVVPMAHAMDGGGSIRIPASCCGLVGLKPTRGRQLGSPSKGLPIDIVTNGVVTRTVRDTANFFAAMEAFHQSKKLPAIGKVGSPSEKRLKIGMFTENPAHIEAHPDVANAVLEAGKQCEALGHHVEYIKNPYSDRILLDFLVYYAYLGFLSVRFGRFAYHWKFNSRKVEPFTKGLSQYFFKFFMMAPSSFRHIKKTLKKEYESLMSKYDVVLNPTLQGPTPKLSNYSHAVDFVSCVMRLNNYVNFTIIQNATGAPAITLPMGKCQNGLPIGVQFGAEYGNEKKLLELAFELEEAGCFKMTFP